ncbi:hypothetical protein KDW_45050 [Dictyobacter vulcani]|uniref:PDZ domain-containing protein n=1 Tax=Dictyobacter vulcani TaxID=2607529 RepID=A0A5J4KRR1_9CHLR|nr:aspartyl protease family protein [Dictyobacter vulcani]GER90343.1 hypothetical protein KDW_45050 [Dictyobacter vulcani]
MAVQQYEYASLYVSHNRPYVDLRVTTNHGYSRMARFLVDTAGMALIFTEALVQDLDLPLQDAPFLFSGTHVFHCFSPPTLSIGPYNLDLASATALMAVNTCSLFSGEEVDGILPCGLLSDYCVLLDYPAGVFALAPTCSSARSGEPVPISIHPHSQFLRVQATIAGDQYGLLLDTGASCTMISEAVMQNWEQQFTAWPRAQAAVGSANMGVPGEEYATMMRIPRATLGSLLLREITVVSRPDGIFEARSSSFMTAPIVGALAGNVLKQFRIEIDYRHEMSYWEWCGNSYPYDMDMVGLTLSLNLDHTYYVTAVSDCNYASVRQSVQVGDRLLQIDGLVVTGLPLPTVVTALQGSPGQHYTLLLEREGELRSVSVATARIV